MLNRIPDRSPSGLYRRTRRLAARCLAISLILGITVAATGLAASASARGMSGASGGSEGVSGVGSSMVRGSGAVSLQHRGGWHARSMRAFHPHGQHFFARNGFVRFRDFRSFHHHHRGEFANELFPWGFGFFGEDWPGTRSDLVTNDWSDGSDEWGPPIRGRSDRYERPTVETTPSGVTILRGPGSHHF